MNKRIKELLDQSTKEIWGNNHYNGSPEFEGYEVDHEKFAELIVKECFKAAMIESKGHMNPNDLMARMKEMVGIE